jgi:ankyrin repeat protein
MKHLLITIAVVVLTACEPQTSAIISNEVALHQAVKNGNSDRVEELLIAGVDKNIKIGQWKNTPLHVAGIIRDETIVEILIKFEADVDSKDIFGRTPLHDSAFYNEFEITKLILSKAININAVDNYGYTPLDLARERGHTNIANLLLNHDGKAGEELKAEGK